MTKEDYIKTIHVAGKDIKLGLDDYGQCYYIEYVDDDGKTQEVSLGTYNFEYMEDIYCMFDKNYSHLAAIEILGEPMTEAEKKEINEYRRKFQEEYRNFPNL